MLIQIGICIVLRNPSNYLTRYMPLTSPLNIGEEDIKQYPQCQEVNSRFKLVSVWLWILFLMTPLTKPTEEHVSHFCVLLKICVGAAVLVGLVLLSYSLPLILCWDWTFFPQYLSIIFLICFLGIKESGYYLSWCIGLYNTL